MTSFLVGVSLELTLVELGLFFCTLLTSFGIRSSFQKTNPLELWDCDPTMTMVSITSVTQSVDEPIVVGNLGAGDGGDQVANLALALHCDGGNPP